MPAAVQERAASWTRIYSKQPRLLGDISKEARKALDNDPLVRCPARSRSHGPSSFLKKIPLHLTSAHSLYNPKLFKNQIRFRNDDKLEQSGSVSPLKTVPNPKGSNVAMTSLHINVTKGVLDGEKSNQLRFGHGNLQKEIPTTRAPFWGIASILTCALLGMKW